MSEKTQEITLPVLETRCEKCGGQGGEFEFSEPVPRDGRGCFYACGPCNGAGFIPTPAGRQVLDLLEHQAKVERMKAYNERF